MVREAEVTAEERNGKDDQYVEVYLSNAPFDESEFTEEELRILESVARLFSGKRTSEIVHLSHQEQAWKDNEGDRQLIDYQHYAFGVGTCFRLLD